MDGPAEYIKVSSMAAAAGRFSTLKKVDRAKAVNDK
jgi:hypothetical protein